MTVAMQLPDGGWVDHISWGVPDTAQGVEMLAELAGVKANIGMNPGPSYPTLSAAISLGNERFLEIYGPNPAYSGPPNWLNSLLRDLSKPRLLMWLVRSNSLAQASEVLASAGEQFQPMLDEWENTETAAFRNGFIAGENANPSIPYLIQWRERYGMDERLVSGLSLSKLWVKAKNPDRTRTLHKILGIEIPIEADTSNRFCIELDTPKGLITLE